LEAAFSVLSVLSLHNEKQLPLEEKPIFSSERILHKDYYRKSSAGKKSLVVVLKRPDAKIT
jgi:hypothetical protein